MLLSLCLCFTSGSVTSCVYCFSYVSVVLFRRLTYSLLFIAFLRYMSCFIIIFHILCFYIFNNHMFYIFMDHMFYIPMNMFDIIISMINYIIYVIIVMLVYEIKMIWKMPIILTNYVACLSVIMFCLVPKSFTAHTTHV